LNDAYCTADVAAVTVANVKAAPVLSWKIVLRWSVPNERWPVEPTCAGVAVAKYEG
jgi:hypothetical protein